MKKPAINFYTSDFLSGVANLTMEERGQYITMLCLQHQQGHLSKKIIKLNIGKVSQDVLNKFEIDKNGDYYNIRLEEEIEKKNRFIEHQRENGLKGGRPRKEENPKETQPLTQNETKGNPLEIGIGIEKENINNNIYSYIESLYKRILTSTEITKIDNLLKEYNEELVRYAIDISIQNNVYKLKYAEAILRDWKNKNLNTKAEVEADELKRTECLHYNHRGECNPKVDEELLKGLDDYDWLNE